MFAFAPVEEQQTTSFLAAGNFYGVVPYEGRYDALRPTVFSYNKTSGGFNQPFSLPAMNGEVRDAKWIKTAGGNVLVIAEEARGFLA